MKNKTQNLLYEQVVDDIRRQLARGELKVGDRLPPEADYAVVLGVSRSTVRMAFTQLEQAGMIERRKRGGTVIVSLKPVQRFHLITSSIDQALVHHSGTSINITDVKVVVEADCCDLSHYAPESNRWLHCTGTRTIEGQSTPFVFTDMLVAEQYVDLDLKAGDRPTTIMGLLENQYDVEVSRVKPRYSAAACSAEIAPILGLAEGDPVVTLFVEIFDSSGQLIELVCSVFNPSRINIVSIVEITESH